MIKNYDFLVSHLFSRHLGLLNNMHMNKLNVDGGVILKYFNTKKTKTERVL